MMGGHKTVQGEASMTRKAELEEGEDSEGSAMGIVNSHPSVTRESSKASECQNTWPPVVR